MDQIFAFLIEYQPKASIDNIKLFHKHLTLKQAETRANKKIKKKRVFDRN